VCTGAIGSAAVEESELAIDWICLSIEESEFLCVLKTSL